MIPGTHPRVGVLELSRLAGVARATVTARMQRIQTAGIVTGYAPQIDVAAFLDAIPGVTEAYATTGTGDVVCRLAAESNEQLQSLLLDLNRSDAIRRSVSVVILSVVVAPRALPLLEQQQHCAPVRTTRSPARP